MAVMGRQDTRRRWLPFILISILRQHCLQRVPRPPNQLNTLLIADCTMRLSTSCLLVVGIAAQAIQAHQLLARLNSTNNWPPARIDRSSVFRSYNVAPVRRPRSEAQSQSPTALDDELLPQRVDWRDRWGTNWVASDQDLGECSGCAIAATTALVETMTRIQHGYWDKRSYYDLEQYISYNLREERDRSGRTTIANYTRLESVEDQKWWLHHVGPSTGGFLEYAEDGDGDFTYWNSSSQGPYYHPLIGDDADTRITLIVGYDDQRSAWIVMSTDGPDYHNNGYVEIGYGQVMIDDYIEFPRYGVTNLNADQWLRRRHRNGNILQSASGNNHRDLEVIRRSSDGNLLRLRRSSKGSKNWTAVGRSKVHDGDSGEPVAGHPVYLESSFDRQKEVLYLIQGESEARSFGHRYYDEEQGQWLQALRPIPGTIDAKTGISSQHAKSPTSTILQSGPSLIQSNVGLDFQDPCTSGNIYVAAVLENNTMALFWRPGGELSNCTQAGHLAANTTWTLGETFGSNIPDTPPVMIQDFWDTANETAIGGFQLLVAINGSVQHWQRLNHDIAASPPSPQHPRFELVGEFGDGNVRHVWGLVQGSFNFALEAIVEDGEGALWHWEYVGPDDGWVRRDRLPEECGGECE
ncbi:hypothetical protein BDV95DRAFT_610238 [Massariosphaeria phaeospora]|uniref:Peptidase C1A papain C-terminal domain-containing protein n=1 Tax=Massariosphaeria phaeospora TaxID=100035 RepID=A0A7C8M478_9PLEO|nr:hypothetical protein BDV95DRAFT_610238 [Massariosphaeria phaeospora]